MIGHWVVLFFDGDPPLQVEKEFELCFDEADKNYVFTDEEGNWRYVVPMHAVKYMHFVEEKEVTH